MIIRKVNVEIIKDEELKNKIPSVYALAKAMNVSHSYVHKIVNDQIPVSIEQYEKIKNIIEDNFKS